jgi:SpoVK/Ycf46/Vps4 family AAA+-type ATPase
MQEKKGGAFVVATANDLIKLPPEFMRRGRFDEIFSVDFPDEKGIAHIFKIHINKKICDKDDELQNKLDEVCEKLAKHKNAAGCAGSDIEAVVNNAVEKSWKNQKPLSYAILEKQLDYITPLEKVLEEKIKMNREKFGKFHLRPAKFTEGDWQMFDVDGQSDEAKEAASDERCPAHILERFAKDGTPEVKLALLENQSCPPSVFSLLTQDADAGIKAKVEEKLTQSEEGQIKIAKEGSKEEKLRICNLPSISGTAQEILAKDSDKEVRRELLNHKYLTEEALTKLAEWNDEEFKEIILAHPSCSEKIRGKLTRSCENCKWSRKAPKGQYCDKKGQHIRGENNYDCNDWKERTSQPVCLNCRNYMGQINRCKYYISTGGACGMFKMR